MTIACGHPSGASTWHGQRAVACATLLTACAAFALTCCLHRRTLGQSSAPVFLNGTASVGDGDSLTVQGRRVRLVGVDAPELQQTCTDRRGRSYDCGEVAAAALRALVGRYSIICEVLKTDRYKRAVARCTRPATLFQRQVDLGEWMLERGHAVVYRQYAGRYLGAYESLEAAARKAGRGLWAGSFVPPWEWRKNSTWT